MNKYKRSPIFYMGNKYKLLPQLSELFPKQCNKFIDLFGGSGVVSLNYAGGGQIVYNEINPNIYSLFNMFSTMSAEDIIDRIKNNIEIFNLNKEGTDVRQNQPDILDVREHYNKNYLKFRNWYNSSGRNIIDLFTLTFYSFSNLIRFNQKSDFNMPYGNRCFTQEHEKIIRECCESLKQKSIILYNLDYREVLNNEELSEKDFVYCDCPYSQTTAIYNEKRAFGGWDISSDYEMFKCLEELNSKHIKWGLSNVFCNKGKTNQHLIDWCEKNNWNVYHLNKTYSALGKGNAKSDEVYICNYRIE